MNAAQIIRFAADLNEAFASLQGATGAHAPGSFAPSLAFLNDLPLAYSEAARQLPSVYDPPEEDLYALANAFTRWRKAELARRTLSELFLADLRVAHVDAMRDGGLLRELPDKDLDDLARILQAWRRETMTRLEANIKGIPADDPLYCPISLFGTMDLGRLETAHTRTLRWLLDPKEGHGFGTTLMECLLGFVAKESGAGAPPQFASTKFVASTGSRICWATAWAASM